MTTPLKPDMRDDIAAAYKRAFAAANGYPLYSLTYDAGWFWIQNRAGSIPSRYRAKQIAAFTKALERRAHDEQATTTDERGP